MPPKWVASRAAATVAETPTASMVTSANSPRERGQLLVHGAGARVNRLRPEPTAELPPGVHWLAHDHPRRAGPQRREHG